MHVLRCMEALHGGQQAGAVSRGANRECSSSRHNMLGEGGWCVGGDAEQERAVPRAHLHAMCVLLGAQDAAKALGLLATAAGVTGDLYEYICLGDVKAVVTNLCTSRSPAAADGTEGPQSERERQGCSSESEAPVTRGNKPTGGPRGQEVGCPEGLTKVQDTYIACTSTIIYQLRSNATHAAAAPCSKRLY